jgi:D-alanyl-D-alanine endopeptidase (penicillin-binding protein 7)
MLRYARKAGLSLLMVLGAAPLSHALESVSTEQTAAPKIDVPVQQAVVKEPDVSSPAKQPATVRHSAKKSSGKGSRKQVVATTRSKVVKKVVMVNGHRKVVYQRVAYRPVQDAPSTGDMAGLNRTRDLLDLKSNVALVLDQTNAQVLFEKNSSIALPIASITKLMTGMVVLDTKQDMDEVLEITSEDIDREKGSTSRLRVGAHLTRSNLLHIALMSSENRAASALGRNYPGGLTAFVAAMNAKAKALGMNDTHYVDSSGLSSHNVSTARDLAKLVIAAHQEPILRQYSTDTNYVVDTGRRSLQYANTNRLVKSPEWEIGLQKTGYISEAGRCLVMQAVIEGRSVVMVLLDSKGKFSRLGDASRIRKWLESSKQQTVSALKHDAV